MINSNLDERIDEILCYIWDPIGVSGGGFPATRDEYSSYVREIKEAIVKGATKQEIAKILDSIQVERMGLNSNLEHCSKVSEAIFAWADHLNLIRPRNAEWLGY